MSLGVRKGILLLGVVAGSDCSDGCSSHLRDELFVRLITASEDDRLPVRVKRSQTAARQKFPTRAVDTKLLAEDLVIFVLPTSVSY